MAAAVWLRLVGGALLVLAGALCGREKRRTLERRAEALRALAAALGRAQALLSATRCPLPELFARLSDAPLFRALSEGFGGGEGLDALWRQAAEAEDLAPPEREALAALGGVLGRCDAERQCAELGLVRARLADAASALERELADRGRRYDGLGAALGAMIAAVLF